MEDVECYKYIPWHFKQKFVYLRKIIQTDKSTNRIMKEIPNFEDDIVEGLKNGLKLNHLVPHCAVLYNLLRKYHSEFSINIGARLWGSLDCEDIT